MIAPLRLFVSSALAWEAPFWILTSVSQKALGRSIETNHVCNMEDFFFGPIEQALLEAGNYLNKLLIYGVLAFLSGNNNLRSL